MPSSWYAQNLMPILALTDAERAHELTFALLRAAKPLLGAVVQVVDPPQLPVSAFGLQFANPLGLAAGLDKQGEALDMWPILGFGFTEIGTITPQPQLGNPRPRLFRSVPLGAIVNRMGFNSDGAQAVATRLPVRGQRSTPIGVNVGKNKDTANADAISDYVAAIVRLRNYADYLVINVSSPNTPELRTLQSPEFLHGLVRQCCVAAQDVPLLVKVAPDFAAGELEATVIAAVDAGAAGIVACNTTVTRPQVAHAVLQQSGGLSGTPLHQLAVQTVQRVHSAVGARVPIIGVGGVASADDAWRLVLAGATLVQVYTSLIFHGPGLIRPIIHELQLRVAIDFGGDWHAAVGAASTR